MSQPETQQKWGKPSNTRTVGDWIDEHGLESWILPLKTREENPLQVIQQVKTRLNEMPKTQSTLTFRNLGFDQLAEQYKHGIMRLFLLRECEHIAHTRFLNPNYMHYGHTLDPVTDADERMAMFEMFRESPRINGKWMSDHFGTKEKSAINWFNDNGVSLRSVRTANQARYGRTLWTMYQWGYGLMDLCELLPVTTNTAKSWAIRYGSQADEWEPPSRPTAEPWYSTRMRTKEVKR